MAVRKVEKRLGSSTETDITTLDLGNYGTGGLDTTC